MSGYAPVGFFRSSPRVRVSPEYCTGCLKCVSVCPLDTVLRAKRTDDGIKAYAKAPDQCVACGRCVRACPTHSIGIYMA